MENQNADVFAHTVEGNYVEYFCERGQVSKFNSGAPSYALTAIRVSHSFD
jgi:hypothetical protein